MLRTDITNYMFSSKAKRTAGIAAVALSLSAGLAYLGLPSPALSFDHPYDPKAKPNKITFKRGARSAVVPPSSIKGDEEAEYEFDSGTRKRLTIRIHAQPVGSVYPQISGPLEGHQAQKLHKNRKGEWQVVLPFSGVYSLSIVRVGKTAGPSRYSFTVTLR